MSTLFWQLAWAGPRMQGQGWAVMPDPAQGNARLACVPVEERDGRVVLALPDPHAPIDTLCAPLNEWTRVTPPHSGSWSALLCLLGYDQPVGQVGGNWVQQPGQPRSLGLQGLLGPHLQPTAMHQRAHVQPPSAAERVPVGPRPSAPGEVGAEELQRAIDRFYDTARDALFGHVIRPPVLPPRMTPGKVTLAFASCQYPAGFMDRGPAEASCVRLEKYLERCEGPVPSMLLLVGDQIYADATAGLIDPIRMDDRYRVPYEEWLRIEPLRRIMGRIPVLTMLDDHEITDNWEPYRSGATGPKFEEGVHAFWAYQRMLKQRRSRNSLRKPTWFKVRNAVEGWSLFMADSRTRRDLRNAGTLGTAEILGTPQIPDAPDQMKQLLDWLVAPLRQDDLKLIATPAMLLPRLIEHQDAPLHLDNWQGYPQSLHSLLAYICDQGVRDVCFLSGDAHLGVDAAIRVRGPDGQQAVLRSIHSPALYAPMPFANEQPHNLALGHDRFEFDYHGALYTCDVDSRLLASGSDGCCLLEAQRKGGGWDVLCKVL